MSKEELFEAFKILFPNWGVLATSYRKIGSRTLAITFDRTPDRDTIEEVSRVFLYVDQNNWQFGTKLWRKRPEHLQKKSR